MSVQLKVLSREDYYVLFAYFRFASEAQEEVRKNTKLITELLGEGREEAQINDSVYDPQIGSSKKEYDELLSSLGISVEWKLPENKFSKQERAEEKK